MMPLMPRSTTTPSVTPPTAMPLRNLRSQSWRRAMKKTMRIGRPSAQRRLTRLAEIGHRLELVGAADGGRHAGAFRESFLTCDNHEIALGHAREDFGAQKIAHTHGDRPAMRAAA